LLFSVACLIVASTDEQPWCFYIADFYTAKYGGNNRNVAVVRWYGPLKVDQDTKFAENQEISQVKHITSFILLRFVCWQQQNNSTTGFLW